MSTHMALGSEAIDLPFCSTVTFSKNFSYSCGCKDAEASHQHTFTTEDMNRFVDTQTGRKCDKKLPEKPEQRGPFQKIGGCSSRVLL